MKTIMKYILTTFFLLSILAACNEDFGDTEFVKSDVAPTDITAQLNVTQDNTGVVSITPNSKGAVVYKVYFGDDTAEASELKQGETVVHAYPEGTYELRIVAISITGLEAEVTMPLEVSFKAPENLKVTITNDEAVSKKVNVTVKAEHAVSYEVDFGESNDAPMATANIGEAVSYTYAEAGTYVITVTVKGAAIKTTKYEETFEVTAILQPISAAPDPPMRSETDYVSIFSNAYTNVAGVDYFPDWGQGGQGSSWAVFDLEGDNMLQYIKLSYQGLQFAEAVDVSSMEYLHLDVWTPDVEKLETSLISLTGGEKSFTKDLVASEWNSIDIPLSVFTEQGLTVADIHQLKFVGTPWAKGTVFVDNIYFYKTPSSDVLTAMLQNFEAEVPAFTTFGNIAAIEVIENPDVTDVNGTAKVAKMLKSSGSETWAGAFFKLPVLDLSTYKYMRLKIWSPKADAVVKVKLENVDASITYERNVKTTVANVWEDLVFDFSEAPAADYVKVVLFFDFGNVGDDTVYYFDEIELLNSLNNSPAPMIFQDFEAAAPTFTVFGNIADIEVIDNPDATGINTTAKVAKMLKSSGSETWAGAFFKVPALDLNTYKHISIKTWSPKSGVVVKMKLENADASITHEVDMNTTVANAWEELTFNFSEAPVGDYVKVVLFLDFGNTGDDAVYYYDEFTLKP